MKAIVLDQHGGPEVLQYRDLAVPSPGTGEVLIRVEAAGVNLADTMRRRNEYLYPSPPPFIPGGEVAGTIAELDLGVEGFELDAPVFATTGQGGFEGYAQFALAKTAQVIPIPPGLDGVRACALVIAGATAVLTLRDAARLQGGESVSIQAAAGGVAMYAVQVAKRLGAGTVIAAASTLEKRHLAQVFRADCSVDYTADGWGDEVRTLTKGWGVDIVLDMIGGRVSQASLAALAPFGQIVVFECASREGFALDTQTLLSPNQSIIGFYCGGWFKHRMAKAMQALQLLIGEVLAGLSEGPDQSHPFLITRG